MKRFFVAFVLMVVGFAASAELVHKTYEYEGLGKVFVEYDTSNKGLVYKENNVLVCQAHLAQFYSRDCNVNVSEIVYRKPSIDDSQLTQFIYKTTKKYGWTVTTIDNVKFCHYYYGDNTIAEFSIVLFPSK